MNTRETITNIQLWEMSAEDFNNWRRKHDYPILIDFFIENVEGFKEWKQEFHFKKEDLSKPSLGAFIRDYPYPVTLAKFPKSDICYVWERSEIRSKKSLGKGLLEKDFIPFLTWYKEKNEIKTLKYNQIPFIVNSIRAYESPQLSSSHITRNNKEIKLLKLGGLKINNPRLQLVSERQTGREIQTHVRNLDFCDLDFLQFTRDYAYTTIHIDFSTMRHLILNKLDSFAFINSFGTNFKSLRIQKSKISRCKFDHCQFYDSQIEDSDLVEIEILNSSCNFVMNRARFLHLKTKLDIIESLITFKSLKVSFKQNGDIEEAGKYYYLEQLSKLLNLKKEFQNLYRDWKVTPKSPFKYYFEITKKLILHFLKLTNSIFQNIFWGYGQKPHRILFISIAVILIFSFVYYFSNIFTYTKTNYFEALSISAANFITLAYKGPHTFDMQIYGFLKYIAIFEGFSGIFLISAFVAGLASKHNY